MRKQVLSIVLAAIILLSAVSGCSGITGQDAAMNANSGDIGQGQNIGSPLPGDAQTGPTPTDTARTAVIEDLAGSVTAVSGGDELAAFRGLALLRDDAIGTGAQSWSSLEFNEGWFALIEENTDVQISELAESASHTEVAVSEGKIWVVIMGVLGDDENFQVKTPNATMSVRGTVFSVEYRDSTTRIAVFEGTVNVIAGDESFDVTVGEGVEIFANDSGAVEVSNSELTQDDAAPLMAGATVEPSDVYEKLQSLLSNVAMLANQISIYEIGDIVQMGGYDWRVLDIKDSRALLLSDLLLEGRKYHNMSNIDYSTVITWEDSDMRAYLNGAFYDNTFSDDERMRILETTISNDGYKEHAVPGGNDTADRVFLLSVSEVVQYFGDSEQLANNPRRKNSSPMGNLEWEYTVIDDQYNDSRMAYYANGEGSDWWLRSPLALEFDPTFVYSFGVLIGTSPAGAGGSGGRSLGVRPAMWITLEP